MSYFLEASTFLLSIVVQETNKDWNTKNNFFALEFICINCSTDWSHGHWSAAGCMSEVDRRSVQKVYLCIHLRKNKEAQEETKMKLKESCALQWLHHCALNYLCLLQYCLVLFSIIPQYPRDFCQKIATNLLEITLRMCISKTVNIFYDAQA